MGQVDFPVIRKITLTLCGGLARQCFKPQMLAVKWGQVSLRFKRKVIPDPLTAAPRCPAVQTCRGLSCGNTTQYGARVNFRFNRKITLAPFSWSAFLATYFKNAALSRLMESMPRAF
jgi:hypothetical protein